MRTDGWRRTPQPFSLRGLQVCLLLQEGKGPQLNSQARMDATFGADIRGRLVNVRRGSTITNSSAHILEHCKKMAPNFKRRLASRLSESFERCCD